MHCVASTTIKCLAISKDISLVKQPEQSTKDTCNASDVLFFDDRSRNHSDNGQQLDEPSDSTIVHCGTVLLYVQP